MQVSGLGDDSQLNLRDYVEVAGGVNAITLGDRYPRRGAPLAADLRGSRCMTDSPEAWAELADL
jgi:hypothetical protein